MRALEADVSERQADSAWHHAVVVWPLGPWLKGQRLKVIRSVTRYHHFLKRPVRYVLLSDENGFCLEYMEEAVRKHLAVLYQGR